MADVCLQEQDKKRLKETSVSKNGLISWDAMNRLVIRHELIKTGEKVI